MSTDTVQSTKVVTDLVRFSYLHIWEPVAIKGSVEKKYSVSLIVPKSNKTLVAKIKKAIDAAIQLGKGEKFEGKIPPKLEISFADGDIEKPDDIAYVNSYYISAKAKTKPGIVDKDLNPIMDQDEVYSGCYGRASITFYAYNVNGNKGIAAGLNHLMKLKDGEHLGGRSTAESDFGDNFQLADDDDDLM